MGKQGAFVSLQTDSLRQQSMVSGFSVAAKDTTAAGDTFNGALLVALAEGLSIEQAIRFSDARAALSVTRMGAQTSLPQREEVDAFLSQPSPM